MKGLFPAFATPQSRSQSWLTSLDEMDRLQARVGELKREGKTADETAKVLTAEFAGKYPDWAQPVRVQVAATAIYAELP